jgi:hypothetical protein
MTALWHSILHIAIQAPSPHNVQPWRIKIHDQRRCTLYLDRTLMLPYTDHTGSFMISAMGMLTEAIRITAANHGWGLCHTLLPDEGTPELMPVAAVELLDQPGERLYPDLLFASRRTSRLPMLTTRVAPEALAALSELAGDWDQRFTAVEDPNQIERILQRNIAALSVDLNDRYYHDELAPWLRFSERQSVRARDGLDARCMAMRPLEYWLGARCPWLLEARLTGSLMRRRYRRTLGSAPAIGLIGGPFWGRASAFDAGRFLMRFWLELAQHGLSIHPLGNLVTNRSAAAWMIGATGQEDTWLVFRLGYSPQAPKSRRRALDEVIR